MSDESAAAIYSMLQGARLEAQQFVSRDTKIDFDGQLVRYGVDSDLRHALIVPMSADELDVSDGQGRAISIKSYAVSEVHGRRQLIVRCEDTALSKQFSLLIDDMVSALSASPVRPGEACVRVLDRWRHLLEESRETLLGPEAQIGLLAELHVVESLVRLDPARALSFWTGHDKARHDFSRDGAAVEVKATTSRDDFIVRIHGARQLDEPIEGALRLYAERLEASPTGENLNDVVNRLLSSGVDANTLLGALANVGYRLDDASKYEGYRFVVLQQKLCDVDANFPRLVRSSLMDPLLMDRISRLEYAVNIGPLSAVSNDSEAPNIAGDWLLNP